MIQRIQSLHLLIVLVLLSFFIFMPYANIVGQENTSFKLLYNGLFQLNNKLSILIQSDIFTRVLLFLSLFITFITIFLFKNRKRQIRACWISILALFFFGLRIVYQYYSLDIGVEIVSRNFSILVIVPIISVILVYLAMKAIRKDEELVKSVDRIR